MNPTSANLHESPGSEPAPSPALQENIWENRIKMFAQVVFLINLGIFLLIWPWRAEWSQNSLLAPYPVWKHFIEQGYIRGAVSGLGLINIWMGIWEGVHYHEQ